MGFVTGESGAGWRKVFPDERGGRCRIRLKGRELIWVRELLQY